jgi:hypothetical protein
LPPQAIPGCGFPIIVFNSRTHAVNYEKKILSTGRRGDAQCTKRIGFLFLYAGVLFLDIGDRSHCSVFERRGDVQK